MRLVEEHHAETALSNTAADREWQFAFEEALVEVKRGAIFLASELELAEKSLRIDTDAHRRELHGTVENRIPNEQIAIETEETILILGCPVIVVRSAEIMLLAIAKLATNAHDEHGAMLLADGILALLRSHVRVHLTQLLRVDEENVLREERLDGRVRLADIELSAENGAVDLAHNLFQEGDITL